MEIMDVLWSFAGAVVVTFIVEATILRLYDAKYKNLTSFLFLFTPFALGLAGYLLFDLSAVAGVTSGTTLAVFVISWRLDEGLSKNVFSASAIIAALTLIGTAAGARGILIL